MSSDDDLKDLRLLDLPAVADRLGRSPTTIEQWVREGCFPRPIQMQPGTKRQWPVGVIRAQIAKRARSSYVKKAPRGMLLKRRHVDAKQSVAGDRSNRRGGNRG